MWNEENQKSYPHVYLNGSPFPKDFDEEKICYHGGTAVAILAGILTPDEVDNSLKRMAYDILQPMIQRVVDNQAFFEWYTPAGEPEGSGTFRGEAGVRYSAIETLREAVK